MKDKDQVRLVKRTRRGDKDAFRKLIQMKERKILCIATSLMGNAFDGEDAAQEAVITIGRKIDTLDKAELFDTWMYRIVFNVCMDERRKRARNTGKTVDLETVAQALPESNMQKIPEKRFEDAAEKEEILAAINQLPERYRMCMLLFYYEGMNYSQIAQTLQVNETVVANTLKRARERLRISLADYNGERACAEGNAGFVGTRKAGIAATVPASLIVQAFAMNERASILPGSFDRMDAAVSAISLSSVSAAKVFFTASAGKAAIAASVGAIALGIAGVIALNAPAELQALPEEQPAIQASREEPVAAQEYSRTAALSGIPEGAETQIISAQDDLEAWEEFQATIDQYHFEKSIADNGYCYSAYTRIDDPYIYVVVITEEEAVS